MSLLHFYHTIYIEYKGAEYKESRHNPNPNPKDGFPYMNNSKTNIITFQ